MALLNCSYARRNQNRRRFAARRFHIPRAGIPQKGVTCATPGVDALARSNLARMGGAGVLGCA
jgi:hypothetical protein